MATKKSVEVEVPVQKHKQLTVRRGLGTRMRKELEEELAADIAAGYKVCQIAHSPGQVHLHMAKCEDWTLGELLSEIEERLNANS